MNNKLLSKIVDFLFEAGTAKNIKRSHKQVLPKADDTIASHSFRVALTGLILASLEQVNADKVIKMCLLHDVAELRTGDANFVNQQYTKQKEEKAIKDQWKGIPGGEKVRKLLEEFNTLSSKEALVAKDADILEQILLQKEYLAIKPYDLKLWHEHQAKNLKTKSAKLLASKILKRNLLQWVYNFAQIQAEDEK